MNIPYQSLKVFLFPFYIYTLNGVYCGKCGSDHFLKHNLKRQLGWTVYHIVQVPPNSSFFLCAVMDYSTCSRAALRHLTHIVSEFKKKIDLWGSSRIVKSVHFLWLTKFSDWESSLICLQRILNKKYKDSALRGRQRDKKLECICDKGVRDFMSSHIYSFAWEGKNAELIAKTIFDL